MYIQEHVKRWVREVCQRKHQESMQINDEMKVLSDRLKINLFAYLKWNELSLNESRCWG